MGHRTEPKFGKGKASEEGCKKKVRANNPKDTLRKASVGPLTLKKYEAVLLEFRVSRGRGLEQGEQCHGSSDFSRSWNQRFRLSPSSPAKHEGLVCPLRSRVPIPYEATCLLSQAAMRMGKMEIALCLLLSFFLYLRPSEPFRLRVQDVVRPVGKRRRTYQHYTLLLHSNEVVIPSKALQYSTTRCFLWI